MVLETSCHASDCNLLIKLRIKDMFQAERKLGVMVKLIWFQSLLNILTKNQCLGIIANLANFRGDSKQSKDERMHQNPNTLKEVSIHCQEQITLVTLFGTRRNASNTCSKGLAFEWIECRIQTSKKLEEKKRNKHTSWQPLFFSKKLRLKNGDWILKNTS